MKINEIVSYGFSKEFEEPLLQEICNNGIIKHAEKDKILLQEATDLLSIESLKNRLLDEQALLRVASEKGTKFYEEASDKELKAETEKYRSLVSLTSEQEEGQKQNVEGQVDSIQ